MSPGEEVVLLVEDDPTLLDAYRVVLSSKSFRVVTARTVGEAVRRLEKDEIDLVVCDLGLPDTSGVEAVDALRRARTGGDRPPPTLLVLTGEDDDGLRRACRRAGAARYLVKPVSGGELAEILRSVPG